jgi:hypothetical protein
MLMLPALLMLGLLGGIGLAYLIELIRRPRLANAMDDSSDRST